MLISLGNVTFVDIQNLQRQDNFQAQSLQYIFVNHINRNATVTTDKWRSYNPIAKAIAKAYNITQIESNGGIASYNDTPS